MEGLVNYGSDDELESSTNAAERKRSNHHNKYKSRSDRRSRSASDSSSPVVNAKDEGGYRNSRNDRHSEKDTLRSKDSERFTHKSKRDTRESARDRDRMPEKQHYRSTRDGERNQRDRHERNERYYDNKSHSGNNNNDRDYRRRSDYQEERNSDRYHRKESDKHRRNRDSDSRSKQRYEVERGSKHEYSSSHIRKDSRRSISPQQTSSDRKRRFDKSRSKTPEQKNRSHREQKQTRETHREPEQRYANSKSNSTESTVQKKSADTDAVNNDLLKNTQDTNVPQLPKYYNPNVVNPNKYAEQIQKRKLLWSGKKGDDNAGKWGAAQFSQDSDGKVASKFMRLMGIKNSSSPSEQAGQTTDVKSREEMFSSMEQQYEVARQATHTMRGVGLGFSSQSRLF